VRTFQLLTKRSDEEKVTQGTSFEIIQIGYGGKELPIDSSPDENKGLEIFEAIGYIDLPVDLELNQ